MVVILLIALGLPIAFSMMIVGFLGLTYIIGLDPALSMVGQVFFDNGMSYSLSILPLFYYEEALKQFDNDRTVIIFSDDPKWCYEQELFADDRFLVSDNDHLLDLCMMTLCSDFIIANSSFSWWGAWLSDSSNKKVIAPKKWFGPPLDQKNDTKDLYCSGWITL